MKKVYLMTPGPTPVPEQVMTEMAKPIIHHRTAQFQDVVKQAEEGLKYVFQTKNDVLIFASSGTGGAVKRRQDMERLAEANRAFAHFRW